MWLFLTGDGEITHTVLQDLTDYCFTAYATGFMPILNQFSLLQSAQTTLYGPDDEVVDGYTTGGTAGGDETSGLPANVAACITWRIAPHYQGGHPRSYMCGISQGAVASSTSFAGTFLTALNSAAVDFHGDLENFASEGGIETVEHGVVSFILDKEWRDVPVFRRITTAVTDSRIDSQRRRLGRDRVA